MLACPELSINESPEVVKFLAFPTFADETVPDPATDNVSDPTMLVNVVI